MLISRNPRSMVYRTWFVCDILENSPFLSFFCILDQKYKLLNMKYIL